MIFPNFYVVFDKIEKYHKSLKKKFILIELRSSPYEYIYMLHHLYDIFDTFLLKSNY